MPWAIQRIADGALLPEGRPGHRSRTEFGDYGPPRLFVTRGGAQVSLHAWSLGIWRSASEWESTNEYGDGYYVQGTPAPIGKGGRNKDEYRVVEVEILIKGATK